MAGLLARGSQLRLAFPTFRSVARQASLTAYGAWLKYLYLFELEQELLFFV